jgi:hypothetical protein
MSKRGILLRTASADPVAVCGFHREHERLRLRRDRKPAVRGDLLWRRVPVHGRARAVRGGFCAAAVAAAGLRRRRCRQIQLLPNVVRVDDGRERHARREVQQAGAVARENLAPDAFRRGHDATHRLRKVADLLARGAFGVAVGHACTQKPLELVDGRGEERRRRGISEARGVVRVVVQQVRAGVDEGCECRLNLRRPLDEIRLFCLQRAAEGRRRVRAKDTDNARCCPGVAFAIVLVRRECEPTDSHDAPVLQSPRSGPLPNAMCLHSPLGLGSTLAGTEPLSCKY